MTDSTPRSPAGEPLVDADHPWLGLLPFQETHRRYFFGRDREIADLFERVRRHPLTILFGPSGLGKTSLLNAGLCPRLRDDDWLPVLIRLRYPGRNGESDAAQPPALLDQIATAITRTLEAAGHAVPTALHQPGLAALWPLFHDIAGGLCGPSSPRLVLLFDQFEEIFTLGEDEVRTRDDAVRLREAVADLVENRPAPALARQIELEPGAAERFDFDAAACHVAFVLREDYLARLERWHRTLPSLLRNRMELRLLDGQCAFDAVVRPARLDGRDLVSDEVGNAIVHAVADASDEVPLDEIVAVPPLLSLLCARLNERRTGPRIEADLLATSREDILQSYYTGCFAGLPDGTRETIEDLLLSPAGFRESLSADALHAELIRRGVADPFAALHALEDARLITAEERGAIRRIELTHDVLAPLIVRSRDERRERERTQQAQRETAALRRRLVTWTALAAFIAALAVVAITQAVLAQQGRTFSRVKELVKQATIVLNEGYARFSKARDHINRAGELTTALKENLDGKKSRSAELEDKAKALNDQLDVRSTEAKSLADELGTMHAQATGLNASFKSLKRRSPKVKAELQEAEIKLQKLDPNLRKQYSEVVLNLGADLAAASKTLEQSTQGLAQIGRKVSALVEQKSVQNGRLVLAQTHLTNTRSAIMGMSNRLAEINQALTAVRTMIDQAEQELKSGRGTLDTTETSLDTAETAINETIARLLGSVRITRSATLTSYSAFSPTEYVLKSHLLEFPSLSRSARATHIPPLSIKQLELPEPLKKILSALATAKGFETDLENLEGKLETFKQDLEELAKKITAVLEASGNIETDAIKLRDRSKSLADETNALEKTASNDSAKIRDLVRDAGTLCTEISADVLRVKQAEAQLRELIL